MARRKVCPSVLLFLLLVVGSLAQSYGQALYTRHQCAELLNRRTNALNNDQDQLLVDASREFLGYCKGIAGQDGDAIALGDLGLGLNDLKQYDDAVPVLRRCAALSPNYTPCWYELGRALLFLGKIQEAKECTEEVVKIGGTTDLNAMLVKKAKQRLAMIDEMLAPAPAPEPNPDSTREAQHSFGTGFFVTRDGHLLTNNHVVANCTTITTRDGKPLQLVSKNVRSDLALLKADTVPISVAVFRGGVAPKLGEGVVAFGFPLPGLLSSEGNVSTGILSAMSGIRNDVRFVQISAPTQPGNSGGPLLDSSGHVIGVVVAKLDALNVAKITGDVPQNVNFAVPLSEVRAFLNEEGISYRKEPSARPLRTSTIADGATRISVAIDCTE
jgi:hypothetical protein